MKKLFLLIIASWATSCLPTTDAQRPSAQAQTKKTLLPKKFNEIIRENKTLKKTIVLNNSFYYGMQSQVAGLVVQTVYQTVYGAPFAVLGLATMVVCSILQDHYGISKENKKNTTPTERIFAHAKGIGLASVIEIAGAVSLNATRTHMV